MAVSYTKNHPIILSTSFMRIFSRLVLFAFLLASFPYISSFLIHKSSVSSSSSSTFIHQDQPINHVSDSVNVDQFLSVFFHDLTNEGLIKKNQNSIFLTNGEDFIPSNTLEEYNFQQTTINNLEKQSTVDATADFVFTFDFSKSAVGFIDRTLKTGAVVAGFISGNTFDKPDNYDIAYMRRFDHVIAVALSKTKPHIQKQRKLLSDSVSSDEAKKAALQKLEDVLLEPPRSASRKSNRYFKRTRYLPDLMGDSLDGYPRRVFIDVVGSSEKKKSGSDWFSTHYPTRNKDFEIYKIETVTSEEEEESPETTAPATAEIGMSDWVRKNVKEEEYVVMKAEAEVVEEMMKTKAIRLVDELFLDCKPQLENKDRRQRRRAYWECLALYGSLRDEGIAVHQWWG